jgi:hypothetical protein
MAEDPERRGLWDQVKVAPRWLKITSAVVAVLVVLTVVGAALPNDEDGGEGTAAQPDSTDVPTNEEEPTAVIVSTTVPTATLSPTATFTPSITPTPTITPTSTITPTPTETATPTDTPTPTETPTPTPTPVPNFGSGVRIVGDEIVPGTYRNWSSQSCYWARLSGFSGEIGDIIANENVEGYEVVTIAPGDAGFESSSRCGRWSQDLSPVTESQNAPFGQGTYIVGVDIAPGTWRSEATGSYCYWARLSGFGGTISNIKANDNVDGQAIVAISANDAGFKSSRCGTWTLLE